MTSNQLQNVANQTAIKAQEETKRHNVASEELEKESLRLQEIRDNNTREYQQAMADIQRKYNDTYLAMQQAQGDERLDLQHELNMIEQEKANIDRFYKTEYLAINASSNQIRQDELAETTRYHDQLKELGYKEADIKMYEAMVRNKQAEYDKYYNENMVRIQDYNALSNRMRIQNDWSLGLMNVENQQVSNEIRNETLQEQKKLWDVQKATMFTGQVWQGIDTIKGLIPGIKLFSK